jgi:hypothetical protein
MNKRVRETLRVGIAEVEAGLSKIHSAQKLMEVAGGRAEEPKVEIKRPEPNAMAGRIFFAFLPRAITPIGRDRCIMRLSQSIYWRGGEYKLQANGDALRQALAKTNEDLAIVHNCEGSVHAAAFDPSAADHDEALAMYHEIIDIAKEERPDLLHGIYGFPYWSIYDPAGAWMTDSRDATRELTQRMDFVIPSGYDRIPWPKRSNEEEAEKLRQNVELIHDKVLLKRQPLVVAVNPRRVGVQPEAPLHRDEFRSNIRALRRGFDDIGQPPSVYVWNISSTWTPGSEKFEGDADSTTHDEAWWYEIAREELFG